MEVSFTSVWCDFLSPSRSKVHFWARFFGMIWIKISDPRDGEWSLKNYESRKLFVEFPGLAVILLFCGHLRLAILHEAVSQFLKAKEFSKFRFVLFFL